MFILSKHLVSFNFHLAVLVHSIALCLSHAFTCASQTSLPFNSLTEWFKMLTNDTLNLWAMFILDCMFFPTIQAWDDRE